MTIKVLAFGQISDIISHKEMSFSNMNNTEELKEELLKKYPAIHNIHFTMAVNKKIVNQKSVLNDQDTVALLPAYSGG